MIFELAVLVKVFWSAIAAVGFGILFNIPKRIIMAIFLLSGLAALVKFTFLLNHTNIIIASLVAASCVGFGSIPIARQKKTSPFLISIPVVIPMIPGYYAYKMLLGLLNLAVHDIKDNDINTILSITKNGLNMLFILMALSIGVSLPWLIFRKSVLQKIRLERKDDLI